MDFNNKTVSFGAYRTYGSSQILGNGIILRGYDENSAALFCAVMQNTAGSSPNYFPVVFSITGDIISSAGTGYNFPYTHTYITNPVKVGNSSMLICSSAGTLSYATLFNCETGAAAMTTQVQIPGVTSAIMHHTLFSYDKNNNKYILIYGTSANIYAITVTVNGNNISFGSPQLLGATSSMAFPSGQAYMPAGPNCSDADGTIILAANSASGYGPARFQILSVDSSGIVSKSPVQNLPVFNTNNYLGSSCLAYSKSGKIYLTGIDYEISPRDTCLLEFTLDGTDANIKKFRPFQSLEIANESYAMTRIKNSFYENPDNPGEFLFMQSCDSAPLANLTFWFGRKTDCVKPDHIIGVAIDQPVSGNIRVQTAGKYLPGLYNNLKPGQLYTAGSNGELVPFTNLDGMKPLGIAAGQSDLLFWGAMHL
ncbi:MAG: hypothetical protein FWF92_02485 [Oscillospiraceae bacterium]|nr:hypothetical protein [Oscillospiraceae bacterium]